TVPTRALQGSTATTSVPGTARRGHALVDRAALRRNPTTGRSTEGIGRTEGAHTPWGVLPRCLPLALGRQPARGLGRTAPTHTTRLDLPMPCLPGRNPRLWRPRSAVGRQSRTAQPPAWTCPRLSRRYRPEPSNGIGPVTACRVGPARLVSHTRHGST